MALYEEFSVGRIIYGKAGGVSVGLLGGTGTSTIPEESSEANKNFLGFWLKSTATTGTTRGIYMRTYLNSGAGGETIRAFTTVSSNTPADTCNGAHISLSFGSSAGNITGLGTAVRGTLHIPGRALTGTTAAIQAEIYADSAASDISGTCSLIRGIVDGEATGKATCDSKTYFLNLSCTDGSGEMVYSAQNEPTWASKTAYIKCIINGTVHYLVAFKL